MAGESKQREQEVQRSLPKVNTAWCFQNTAGGEATVVRVVQRRVGDKVREVWNLEERSRLVSQTPELSALESN